MPSTGDIGLAFPFGVFGLTYPSQHDSQYAGSGRFAARAYEGLAGADYNGDGDTSDQVVHVVGVDANPPPSVSIGDAALVEGDTGVRSLYLPVTLSEPSTETMAVDYTITAGTATPGTAKTAGADFNHKAGKTKTLTFKVGAKGTTPVSKFVTVPVYPDTTTEGDETFTVTLSSPSGGSTLYRAVATGTIVDDDAAAKSGVEISAGDVSIVEGADGRRIAKAALTLSDEAASEVRVDYTVIDGTADCGPSKKRLPIDPASDCDDRKGVTKTAIFKVRAAKGTTSAKKALPAFVFPDGVAEGDESFSIVLSNPVGASIRDGSAVITMLDDD